MQKYIILWMIQTYSIQANPLKTSSRKHILKNIVHWLRANKISLNTKKTEIVLFRAHKTIIKKNMNFQISGQKVNIIYERNKIFRDGNG